MQVYFSKNLYVDHGENKLQVCTGDIKIENCF